LRLVCPFFCCVGLACPLGQTQALPSAKCEALPSAYVHMPSETAHSTPSGGTIHMHVNQQKRGKKRRKYIFLLNFIL
jgi:hypothetical protein